MCIINKCQADKSWIKEPIIDEFDQHWNKHGRDKERGDIATVVGFALIIIFGLALMNQ